MSEKINTTIRTWSGKMVDLSNMKPEDIDTYDVGMALSKICRFTGHTNEFYSVAEHSSILAMMVPQRYAPYALVHDGLEAYFGDWSKPLKNLISIYAPELIKKIEANDHLIFDHFGLNYHFYEKEAHSVCKHYEHVLFEWEYRYFMLGVKSGPNPVDKMEWEGGLPPDKAFNLFVTLHNKYMPNVSQNG